ncbi:hypothetical protein NQ176_g10079 [Zarea fungicola]|uniref:Uncharacterized protein n=1 Tax=Zarea fungicola TaxID=93591 RepID=A0ACC1MK41_9HYPO|nr:hypothetical protein NQ176_g10079 [Lecanicillium fungicola]
MKEKGGAHHALHLVEDALCVEQPDRVSRHQAAERVANDAELGDFAALALNLLQLLLNLGAHALAAPLDSVVGEAARVALGEEQVQLVAGVLVA